MGIESLPDFTLMQAGEQMNTPLFAHICLETAI